MSGKKSTTDAIEILRRRYIDGDAERLASLEEERLHARVARRIYDLRTRAGLTQAELAARVDTTQSAISRLEDADYEGHSLSTLRRIAEALGARDGRQPRGGARDCHALRFPDVHAVSPARTGAHAR